MNDLATVPPTNLSTDRMPEAAPEPAAPDLATPEAALELRGFAEPETGQDTGEDMFGVGNGDNARAIDAMASELQPDFDEMLIAVNGGPQTQATVDRITAQVFNQVSQGQSLNEAVQSLSATDLMILSGSIEREFEAIATDDSREVTEDLIKLRDAVGIAAEMKIAGLVARAETLDAGVQRGIEQFEQRIQSVTETVASLQENLPDGDALTEILSGLSEDNLDEVYLRIDELAAATPDNEGLQRLADQVENFAFHGVIERDAPAATPEPAPVADPEVAPAPEAAPERRGSPSQEDLQRLGSINGLIQEGLSSGQSLTNAIRGLPAEDLRFLAEYVEGRLADPTFQVTDQVRELKTALDAATSGTVIGEGRNAQLIRELETEGTRVFAALNTGFVGGPEVTERVNQITAGIGTQVAAGADLNQVVAALPQQDLMLLSGALQREFANPNFEASEDRQQLLAAVQQASMSIFSRLAREETDVAGP